LARYVPVVARRPAGEGERFVAAGEVIVRQDEPASEMFVIRAGTVEIRRGDVVAELGAGDFFGEMSVLESMPRDADAIAVTDVHLLVITKGALLVRLRRDPTFALEMLHRLSGRIRALNAQVVAS
jgi:CRP-like cAMP-binding protein